MKFSRMQRTDASWSADLVTSDGAHLLLIFDEATGRTIIREPVALGDSSSVLMKHLEDAFRLYGVPAQLVTDHRKVFYEAVFGELLHSFGVSQLFTNYPTSAERDRRRQAREHVGLPLTFLSSSDSTHDES